MRHIIYCALLIATWLCSTASVIWVLNFGGLKWMLVAGGCVASFVSSVALAEELVEWHHTQKHRRSKDNRCRLPDADNIMPNSARGEGKRPGFVP